MPTPPATCSLCLQIKPLLDSHFIPAAIYKNLIDPAGTIKNMIATNLSVASEESKQIKQPLLCQECEIRFQQGGESWVLGRRLTPNGSFVLRDLLQQTAPVGTKDGISFFALDSIASVDHAKLLYFAASIFWRAAIADWDTPLGIYTKLTIPMGLMESLRKYLLGTAPFPDEALITAIVSAAKDPADVTSLPAVAPEISEYQQIDWIMPGMGFTLLSGDKVPKALKAISLTQSPYLIAISPVLDERIRNAGHTHVKQSVMTEKLQRKIDQTS